MYCDPYVFVKNFNERLEDLSNILEISVKTSGIRNVWINYTDLCIERSGWHAIWKIRREMCEEFKISYPCIVVVYVQSVNAVDLSCSVTIRKVEDDSVQLPKKIHDVPLVQLYPLKEQDDSLALTKLKDTAELLDTLRFFYNHLWMPWDQDCGLNEDSSWVEAHLEGRLKLYFAIVERRVPGEVAYTVNKLVAEGRRVLDQLDLMREKVEVEGKFNNDSSSCVLTILKLHNTLCDLRNRYRLYETPHLLEALIRNISNLEAKVFLVLSNTSLEGLIAVGEKMKQQLSPGRKIRVVETLQDGLGKAKADSRVLLPKGQHHFHDLYALETGGAIEGLEEGVSVVDDSIGSCSLNVVTRLLTLSNLTLRLTCNLNTIKVRSGAECRLEGVTLEGSSSMYGVDVYSSATFTAVNCVFSGYGTSLTCDNQSSVRLVNCTFTGNKIAMELKEGASISMENCTFSDSKLYAIQIIVPKSISKDETNPVKNLGSISKLQELNTVFNSNKEDLHFESII